MYPATPCGSRERSSLVIPRERSSLVARGTEGPAHSRKALRAFRTTWARPGFLLPFHGGGGGSEQCCDPRLPDLCRGSSCRFNCRWTARASPTTGCEAVRPRTADAGSLAASTDPDVCGDDSNPRDGPRGKNRLPHGESERRRALLPALPLASLAAKEGGTAPCTATAERARPAWRLRRGSRERRSLVIPEERSSSVDRGSPIRSLPKISGVRRQRPRAGRGRSRRSRSPFVRIRSNHSRHTRTPAARGCRTKTRREVPDAGESGAGGRALAAGRVFRHHDEKSVVQACRSTPSLVINPAVREGYRRSSRAGNSARTVSTRSGSTSAVTTAGSSPVVATGVPQGS